MKNVILGAGSFGCALAEVLASNNEEVILWAHQESEVTQLQETYENPFIKGAKISKKIEFTSNLEIVNEADFIIYVVPSFALRDVSQKINKILKTNKNFVICTKGIESNTMKSGYEIVQEEIEKVNNISILSGPTHAEELAFKKYTTMVSTSTNLEYAKQVQTLFNNNYLRVYTNTDINGVEILGAAKNVLAIAAGTCDSHPLLGDNAKAALLTRGLRELKILGEHYNCKAETFYGLTGLGDLIVTATSQFSRNRRFGELVGSGLTIEEAKKEINMVVEGLYSVQAIYQMNKEQNLELPLIESIYNVIYNNYDINEVIENIFKREVKSE